MVLPIALWRNNLIDAFGLLIAWSAFVVGVAEPD
jgi:hypothetical protein